MAIKLMDPKAQFKIVSNHDDALEHETIDELKTGELDENGKEKLKPSRYELYLESESFDESILKFKEGQQPDRFVLRCLSNDESAEINSKYMTVDVVTKTMKFKNQSRMFLEIFNLAFVGLDSGGKLQKVSSAEVPYHMAVEMGSIASMLTSLGKNLKKR
jgi:hypothetical protein